MSDVFKCDRHARQAARERHGGPKYVVTWQTEFDVEMSPQQAGLEALRELRARDVAVHITDCDTNRQWHLCFRDRELEFFEVRSTRWNSALGKHVKEPIKAWDPVMQEYVPVEEPEPNQ